ncbi:acid phosphatase [Commensalibacter melissae]|uniref:acid phosphatase n=1 Tax=Commensalibacter melissae TaxID=2070537 RepID=UPI0012D9AE3E|nr:phosphatase PAP2 family protein [Commensalibacter melissae]MUG08664.1 phosphatase PAP2 family protein [Commensalibacter melissae]
MNYKKTIIFTLLINILISPLTGQSSNLQKDEIKRLFIKSKKLPLHTDQFANSLKLLPSPPDRNSQLFTIDKEIYLNTRKLINTSRWNQAIEEAAIFNGTIGKNFSKTIGIEISKKNTPITQDFLEDLLIMSGNFGTDKAKKHYQRIRPFMYYHTHSCTPEDESLLRKDGSYPSGHAAFGWSAALFLSEIFPDKQDQILKEGYEFGQSRVICGAHWQSDVDAGRLIGAEVVARLHANQEFRKKLKKVKQELLKKSREIHFNKN